MASSPTSKASNERVRLRLDESLVARGMADTRSRARALIMAGDVLLNGQVVARAGAQVGDSDEISLKRAPRFVSRGGEKLEHALATFGLEVKDRIAADFGASTGGFTDCLLQRGAARVYAVDVGYGQLAERLRLNPRVVVLDRVNARSVEKLPEPIDVVTIDVSFIGLRLVLPAARRVLRLDGNIIALVKPQFEAGRRDVGRGGVVRDPDTHRRVLHGLFATSNELRLGVVGLTVSPLRGPAGNIEFLAHLRVDAPSIAADEAIAHALQGASPA